MSDEDLLVRVRALPLFARVDEEHLQRVTGLVTPFEVERGYVLAERGQPGSGMFVILEGTVEAELPNRQPIELGPGEFVGELSLLTDTPRLARVRALTTTRGLAVSRAAFEGLLEEEPRIAVAMLPVIARRLAELEGLSEQR